MSLCPSLPPSLRPSLRPSQKIEIQNSQLWSLIETWGFREDIKPNQTIPNQTKVSAFECFATKSLRVSPFCCSTWVIFGRFWLRKIELTIIFLMWSDVNCLLSSESVVNWICSKMESYQQSPGTPPFLLGLITKARSKCLIVRINLSILVWLRVRWYGVGFLGVLVCF